MERVNDTDISLAAVNVVPFMLRSQLSTNCTLMEVVHLLLIDYYALSYTFGDVCTTYCTWAC